MPQIRRTRSNSMVCLEPAEVLAVLRAAKTRGAREWSMIVLAYKHGLRASEVCSIRMDDDDLENGNIIVERLKGSLRTTQAVTEHRGEPCSTNRKPYASGCGSVAMTVQIFCSYRRRAVAWTGVSSFGCSSRLPPLRDCARKASSARSDAFDCQSPGFCECQSRVGQAAVRPQVDWLNNAVRHD